MIIYRKYQRIYQKVTTTNKQIQSTGSVENKQNSAVFKHIRNEEPERKLRKKQFYLQWRLKELDTLE